MFKGKVTYITNKNGQEKKIEKEFDNQEAYDAFIREHDKEISSDMPSMTLDGWANLHNYMEGLIDRKLGLTDYVDDQFHDQRYEDEMLDDKMYADTSDLIDWDKYDDMLFAIEEPQKMEDDRLEQLEQALAKLKEYKRIFKENEGKVKDTDNAEILKNIDKDIKKLEKELKRLQK